jgi:hypothetical protein
VFVDRSDLKNFPFVVEENENKRNLNDSGELEV